MDQLPNFVTHGFLFGRPDPETPKDGDTSLSDGPSSRLLWPTPRAEDSEQTGGHRGTADTLTSAVRMQTGKKKLNPLFVAWLMGFPPAYLEPTSFGDSAMQSFLSAERLHLEHLCEGRE